KEAIAHLLEAVRIVDTQRAAPEQVEPLRRIYDGLRESYSQRRDGDSAAVFANVLIEFMSDKDWLAKVNDFRRRLDALSDHNQPMALAELLGTADPEHVLLALSASQEYLKRRKLNAAAEECYFAIALAPAY